MTRCARGARLLAVLFVARETAQAFVDSDGSAVVTGADLAAGLGRVALVAESLALVGADFHEARAFVQLRKREIRKRHVVLLTAIE